MSPRYVVWSIFLGACLVGPEAAAADGPGWKIIFDGKNLTGWDGDPRFWRVEDGAITGQTTAEKPAQTNTFIIWRAGSVVDDFELKLEYKIVGGNSGIQYRSVDRGDWIVSGYQADIEAGDTWSGALYEEKGRELLARRGQKVTVDASHKPTSVGSTGDAAKLQAAIKKEDWNEYHVIAKGNHLLQRINGKVTADVVDNDTGARASSGILALQLHAGPPMKVSFRNVRIKRTPLVKGKKVVFIAGHRSHGFGAHDHRAGCQLLAEHLGTSGLGIQAAVYYPDWPADASALDNANALVVYADGAGDHPLLAHIDEISALAKKGLGLGFIHFAVEVEKGKPGDAFLDWIGGYFELDWSVNPHWTPDGMKLAKHPITLGVRPYSLLDEWYYHMRFRPKMEGVTPIITVVPTDRTLARKDGPREGNAAVRAEVAQGQPQHLMWARQRPDGGRGFGFTGAHVHWNWAEPNQRRVVLNAIAWIAKVNIPKDGVPTKEVSADDLLRNQDEPKPPKYSQEAIVRLVGRLSKGSNPQENAAPVHP